jgi:hypothetical protein
MNIWAKGERIEQVRQHRISGLPFNTIMNWFEHNKNTKSRGEKIYLPSFIKFGSRPRKPIESTPNESPRYFEVRRRSIRISYRSSAEET